MSAWNEPLILTPNPLPKPNKLIFDTHRTRVKRRSSLLLF